MLLCLENDLGFPDPEFWGQGCNSESGVVIIAGVAATKEEKPPRAFNDTYLSPTLRPAGIFSLGFLQRGNLESFSRTARDMGEGEPRGRGRARPSVCGRIICPESQIFTA